MNIAYTLDGTRYAVSTTIYYGLKPSINSFTLTVEPPKTEVKTAPEDMLQGNVTATQTSVKVPPQKTPEQLRREAEHSGSLRVWHEFSWWFPWYRFHMVYLLHGIDQFDVGIGLLGGNIINALQNFIDKISRYAKEIVPDLFADYVLREMVAVVGSLSGNLVAWTIAAGISVDVKLYLIYEESWDSLEKLYTSYVSQFVSLMTEVGSFIAEFSLGNLVKIAGSLMKFTSAVWAVLTLVANILLDVTFFFNIIDMRISQLGGQ
jgi:hypothetical protein